MGLTLPNDFAGQAHSKCHVNADLWDSRRWEDEVPDEPLVQEYFAPDSPLSRSFAPVM